MEIVREVEEKLSYIMLDCNTAMKGASKSSDRAVAAMAGFVKSRPDDVLVAAGQVQALPHLPEALPPPGRAGETSRICPPVGGENPVEYGPLRKPSARLCSSPCAVQSPRPSLD